jgi:hypothetical protein
VGCDEQGLSRVVKNLKLLDLPAGSLRVIIMGKLPALPGDTQSLTVPGICAKASPL